MAFGEMGAEIVPYHLIDDIYDQVTREDIVLDYIDQCNMIFNKFGVDPQIPDYPKELESFLGRKFGKILLIVFPALKKSGVRAILLNPHEIKLSLARL